MPLTTLLPNLAAKYRAPKEADSGVGRANTEKTTVTRHLSPIDHRPFQPRAKLEKQEALVALLMWGIAISLTVELVFG